MLCGARNESKTRATKRTLVMTDTAIKISWARGMTSEERKLTLASSLRAFFE
jgi:hypothetical protein